MQTFFALGALCGFGSLFWLMVLKHQTTGQQLTLSTARALAGATASSSSSSSAATTTAASIIIGASSSSSSSSSLFSSRSYAAGTSKSNTNNEADYGLAAGVPEELLNREVREE